MGAHVLGPSSGAFPRLWARRQDPLSAVASVFDANWRDGIWVCGRTCLTGWLRHHVRSSLLWEVAGFFLPFREVFEVFLQFTGVGRPVFTYSSPLHKCLPRPHMTLRALRLGHPHPYTSQANQIWKCGLITNAKGQQWDWEQIWSRQGLLGVVPGRGEEALGIGGDTSNSTPELPCPHMAQVPRFQVTRLCFQKDETLEFMEWSEIRARCSVVRLRPCLGQSCGDQPPVCFLLNWHYFCKFSFSQPSALGKHSIVLEYNFSKNTFERFSILSIWMNYVTMWLVVPSLQMEENIF